MMQNFITYYIDYYLTYPTMASINRFDFMNRFSMFIEQNNSKTETNRILSDINFEEWIY